MPIFQQVTLPTSPVQQQPPKPKLPVPKNVVILIAGILISLTALGTLYVLPSNKKNLTPIRLSVNATPPPRVYLPTATPEPTKKPDPTAGWSSYANKSITMKYPGRFTVTEKTLPFNAQYPKVYTHLVFSDAVSDITITVAKNTPNVNLQTALGSGPYLRYASSILQGKTYKTVSIDNNDGNMVESISAGAAGIRADIAVLAHSKIYEMTLSPVGADAEVFALMLSTMKLLNQEPTGLSDDWPSYVDTPYKFSFRYPSSYLIDYGKVASGSPVLTMVYDNSRINLDAPKFKVEVQDSRMFGQSAVSSRALLQLPLDQYVGEKWQYNKTASDAAIPDRTIGPIKQLAVDGQTAFSFTVTGKYIDDHSQEILSGEYTFVFTQYNGYKYKIWYPSNDTTEKEMFKTFTFLQ